MEGKRDIHIGGERAVLREGASDRERGQGGR